MMTARYKIELEGMVIIMIGIFLGGFFVWQGNQNFKQKILGVTPIMYSNSTFAEIIPTINPVFNTETTSQISPDGAKKLVMEKKQNRNGITHYIFTTTDGSGANEKTLYVTDASPSASFSLSYNAWSPDNKYLFIRENGNNALVFKATGEPITATQTFLDIENAFKLKGVKAKVAEVTGWASETLIIVNTSLPDNGNKASYWFEVPSQAIIQLSSQF